MQTRPVDTLHFYNARNTRSTPLTSPMAFLSALSTPRPVEFHSSQIHHHFNLQLVGSLQTEWYRDRGSSQQVIAPGQVSLNVASEPFRCRVEPTSQTVSLHLVFPVPWMEQLRERHSARLRLAKGRPLSPMLGSWQPQLERIARQIAEAIFFAAEPQRLRIEELLVKLGLRLWQTDSFPTPSGTRERLAPGSLLKVLEFLHAQLGEDLSLDTLAEVTGLSTWHFCRAFRASVGVSPWQYLRAIRLAEARRLLVTTDLPVTSISTRLGFSNSSHFAAAFRNAYSISPTRFRTSCR